MGNLRRLTSQILSFLLLSFLIVSFQNCSPVGEGFQILTSASTRQPSSQPDTLTGSPASPIAPAPLPIDSKPVTNFSKMLISNTSQGLTQPLDPAVGRSCFNQDNATKPLPSTNEAIIVVDEDDHPDFKDRKCGHYFKFYEGKVFYKDANGVQQPITANNCLAHQDEINLRKGYAPFPVMFRGSKSQLAEGIAAFRWELYGPRDASGDGPLIKTSDAFNLAYIFENPGEYKAVLKVIGSQGSESTASTTVSVWARDKKTYYVDSIVGDDRFDGLSETSQAGCDPNVSPVGSCKGPWKTATRSLSELGKPFNVANYPNGKYMAEQFCASPAQIIQASQYNAGFFKIYRSQSVIPNMILSITLDDGTKQVFGPYDVKVCPQNSYVSTRNSILKSGDQILFKRGQTFEMEPGINKTRTYTADVDPDPDKDGIADPSVSACSPIAGSTLVRCTYEIVECQGTVFISHWPQALGVHFGAYGEKALSKPKIQNVGSAACTFIDSAGVGQFNLSFQDLALDMYSEKIPVLDNLGTPARSLFLFSPASAINFAFNRVDLTRFEQGIVLTNEHGVFIHNSTTYDSRVVHFYIGKGTDVSLENNNFEYSGNHLAYTGMSNSVVTNNIFSKPAFGRTALRIDGAGGLKNPNRYNWISDNKFLGWKDPRKASICLPGRCPYADGNRYNYTLVHFGPNTSADLANRDTFFVRNIVKDAEGFFSIGNNENLTIKDNYFSTPDTSGATRVSLAGSGSAVIRPNKNILFEKNIFVDSSTENKSMLINLSNYENSVTLKCDDIPNHRSLHFIDNKFYFAGLQKFYRFMTQREVKDAAGVKSLVSDMTHDQAEIEVKANHLFQNSKIYTNSTKHLFQVNGSIFSLSSPQGFDSSILFVDGVDFMQYPYRAYSFQGASERIGFDNTKNEVLPAVMTYPSEPF